MQAKIDTPYYLQPFEEAIGILHAIKLDGPFVNTKIGPVEVLLPQSMEKDIRPHLGQRIGVLRTDTDYRIKIIL